MLWKIKNGHTYKSCMIFVTVIYACGSFISFFLPSMLKIFQVKTLMQVKLFMIGWNITFSLTLLMIFFNFSFSKASSFVWEGIMLRYQFTSSVESSSRPSKAKTSTKNSGQPDVKFYITVGYKSNFWIIYFLLIFHWEGVTIPISFTSISVDGIQSRYFLIK